MTPAVSRALKRPATLFTVALAGITLLAPDADARRSSSATSSSFGYAAGTTTVPDAFLGEITSRNPACEGGRKATVFRQRRGRDARIGSDRTSSTGQWIIEKRRARPGRYYLTVKRKRLHDGGRPQTCGAYRSSKLPMGD